MIITTTILTPLGPMLAATTAEGICLLEFEDRRLIEKQIATVKRRFKSELKPGSSPILELLQTQMTEYFAGRLREFTVPLDMMGTDFQKKVWEALQTIPYGNTRTYTDQAVFIGKPAAVRAVAKANGDNPISIIIPCHRVIGKNGKLVGYGGGLQRKKVLLELEAKYC